MPLRTQVVVFENESVLAAVQRVLAFINQDLIVSPVQGHFFGGRNITFFRFRARKKVKKVLKPYCLSSFHAFCYIRITSTICWVLELTQPQHIGNL